MEILHNDTIQLGVCPDKGGRIYSLSFCGGTDRFYHAPESKTSTGWNNWGGDILWVAPQSTWGWPPPKEWETVPWDMLPDDEGVLLLSGLFRGVQLQRHIDFEGKHTVRVVNTLRAISEPCDWGLWNVTQLPVEGVTISTACDSAIHVFEYPPDSDIDTLRRTGCLSGDRLITLSSIIDAPDYKVGWYDPIGQTTIQYPDGVKLIKQFELQPKSANYPHGGNVEFYHCKHYQEAEIGWSQVKLKPGESVSVTQRFTLERS